MIEKFRDRIEEENKYRNLVKAKVDRIQNKDIQSLSNNFFALFGSENENAENDIMQLIERKYPNFGSMKD